MKLYIATTSLNFDAIVSTDSVSPAAFYQQRGFGITLFYDKASFFLPNSILLTDAFPIFSINRSEVDHRPMVVEIDTKDYPPYFEAVKRNGDNIVYQTERTIYLSPSTSKIYFFSEADLRSTLAKAESILESKYILYVKLGAIKVFDRSMPTIKIGQETFKKINDAPVPNSKFITKDIGINKAKGFIISYMIGAGMAIAPESARLLKLSKDIKNGIYSLGTKEEKTDDAVKTVLRLANEAEELSSYIDPKKQEARERVLQYLSAIDASSMLRGASYEEIVLFLEKIGVYSSLFVRLNGGRLISIVGLVNQALSSRDDTLTESTLDDISHYVMSIIQRSSAGINVSDFFKLGLDRNYIECSDPSLALESKRKVEILFNLYSGYSYKAAGIRQNRVDYIIDAGREFFSETTDGDQEERDYINAMLDNLEHASSFDMLATSSQALQSLAVFMRSPDADLDKMASLIVSNEISDARIAFGLWGLFYGYSNIPQSYYNTLVQSLNNKDAANFVGQIHDALFGATTSHEEEAEPHKEKTFLQKALSLVGFGEEKENEKESIPPKQKEENLFSSAGINLDDEQYAQDEYQEQKKTNTKPEPELDEVAGDVEPSKDTLPDDGVGDMPNGYENVYNLIWPLLEKAEVTKQKTRDEFFAYYPAKVKEVCDKAQSLIGLSNGIDSIPCAVAKTAWKGVRQNIKELIEQLQLEEIESKSRERRAWLENEFSSGRKRKFYRDEYAWDIVLSVLPNEKAVIDQVERDFSWFMENYGNPPYYENKSTDNESCLNAFNRYLKNKIEKPNISPSVKRVYLRVDINSLMSILREMYS